MDTMEDDDKPREYCGIYGICNHPEAANLTREGLFALQHRGQESAGIFLRRPEGCEIHKGMGLVGDIFSRLPKEWWKTEQDMAIGHVRYSTAGGSSLVNAQPFDVEFGRWHLGIAHNGTISNAGVIKQQLRKRGSLFQGNSDTELILHLAAACHEEDEPPWEALKSALVQCEGAFSIVAMCEDGMAVARDPHGFRPLCMGKLGDSIVFASETCAFDMSGAEYIRDVEPGEFIVVRDGNKIESQKFAFSPISAHCIFELVYFSRPDSIVFGEKVSEVRKRFGAKLAEESPAEVDVVMPVPDGGMFAALGYAHAAGLPFDMGIMRNHYIGRTFIQPSIEDRRTAVKIKLNPIRASIEGKRILLIDDSIVRGNTSRERVRILRECGAKEVHMRVSCPPHIAPCYYGIDFPSADELVANHYTTDEIAEQINVDSLSYLSLDGMLSCVRENDPKDFCAACFTKKYPVKPKFGKNGKDHN